MTEQLISVESLGGSVQKIWSGAPHCAFTDLIRFRHQWFCAFRESDSHVKGLDGKIRVLRSPDGDHWQSVALLAEDRLDLRDPQLSITPDGRLMLLFGVASRANESVHHETHAAFSDDGCQWSPPQFIGLPDQWLWRVTWHDGRAYGISREFITDQDGISSQVGWLVVSDDGISYQVKGDPIPGASECALHFSATGTMQALVRRVGRQSSRSTWGINHPPYTSWSWRDIPAFIGGPRLIEIDGRVLAGGRHYPENRDDLSVGGPPAMELAWVDEIPYRPFLRLPSGGDTSYPGFAILNGNLLISYYSSHEGSTAIYLAHVPLETLRSPSFR